ncbi:DgyrCDS13729 [Dimorphilus gyrociliatus]|uniref:DgyrCDS13729 n=1 Tax=Dimorphilus gyrociliatus TaxID=2664684 RepID=A0A7I8WBL3_9ANNE|nr:DgyrCDS13729 [Dimorphilus gyrociliatus]
MLFYSNNIHRTGNAISICRYGTCLCKFDFSIDGNQCHKLKTLGEDCEKDNAKKMCYEAIKLQCENEKCICKENYEPDGENPKGCILKNSARKGLGETCENSDECSKDRLSNAFCQDNKCKCYFDATTVGDKCVKQNYGESCQDGKSSEKCRGTEDKNMECKDKVCKCKSTFTWKRNMCLKEGSVIDRDYLETCTPVPKGKADPVQLCKTEFFCYGCSDDAKLKDRCVNEDDTKPPKNSGLKNSVINEFIVLTIIFMVIRRMFC